MLEEIFSCIKDKNRTQNHCFLVLSHVQYRKLSMIMFELDEINRPNVCTSPVFAYFKATLLISLTCGSHDVFITYYIATSCDMCMYCLPSRVSSQVVRIGVELMLNISRGDFSINPGRCMT